MAKQDKVLKIGKWVRWRNSDGTNWIGHISGEPGTNRHGETVYPVEMLNGSKTAVSKDKLTVIPGLKAGKLSQKRRSELLEECVSYNQVDMADKKKDDIDKESLLQAREKEIEDLRQKLEEYKDLKENFTRLQERSKELLAENELLKKNTDVSTLVQAVSENVERLKKIIDGLLGDVTEPSNGIVMDLLPIVYSLIKEVK